MPGRAQAGQREIFPTVVSAPRAVLCPERAFSPVRFDRRNACPAKLGEAGSTISEGVAIMAHDDRSGRGGREGARGPGWRGDDSFGGGWGNQVPRPQRL